MGVVGCASHKPELVKWIKSIIARAKKENYGDLWSALLHVASDIVLGNPMISQAPLSQQATVVELALWRWIAVHLGRVSKNKETDIALLKNVLLQVESNTDTASAAVLFCSLHEAICEVVESDIELHWQVGRTQKDAESLVETLCRRFHLFAQQLLNRYDNRDTVQIADEYDVQDLMHALLKFHFDDVRAEEVTPSLAGKSGRMDFLLKRERIVVETKMTRKTLGQREVGDELIIDMKRYRSHPDYGTLVCLVYDPEGYCHAPSALENDLSGTEGDFRTTVIVCPRGL